MKTRDAFAFRSFDSSHILQRPYFRKWREQFHVGTDDMDEKILSTFTPAGADDIQALKGKAKIVAELLTVAENYQRHIVRHLQRLKAYQRAVADRLVAVDADIAELRNRHGRAGELAEKYTSALNDVPFTPLIAVDNVRGFVYPIVSTAKEIDAAIRQYFSLLFGRRLQQARKAAGLSRRDFAERIEISWRRLVAYELGTREPPLAILVNIAQQLKISLDWLVGLK